MITRVEVIDNLLLNTEMIKIMCTPSYQYSRGMRGLDEVVDEVNNNDSAYTNVLMILRRNILDDMKLLSNDIRMSETQNTLRGLIKYIDIILTSHGIEMPTH